MFKINISLFKAFLLIIYMASNVFYEIYIVILQLIIKFGFRNELKRDIYTWLNSMIRGSVR